jgi:uncharacterized DUF497 family protein
MHTSAHTKSGEYEWDPAKAQAKCAKYGVRFADAVTVLEDDLALTMRDPFSVEEERWITVGRDAFGRILVVVYTWRGSVCRISAGPATTRETAQYEEHHEA